MSQSIFPTLIVNSFIPSLWFSSTGFSREYADLHYVKYPIAQGSQSFPVDLSVTGITTLGETNLQTKNTVQNLTHYLNFSDSSSTGVGQIQKSANFSVNPSTGALTASGLITATGGLTAGGLTISGANNITLGNGSIVPTTGTQLGGTTRTVIPAQTIPTTVVNLVSFTLPVGTYLITTNMLLTYGGSSSTVGQAQYYWSTTNSSSGQIIGTNMVGYIPVSTSSAYVSLPTQAFTYQVVSATTLYLMAILLVGATAPVSVTGSNSSAFFYTRLA
jgi:hypothetical protein